MTTAIGYPTVAYSEGHGEELQLGSGLCFSDEAAGARELAANASRIEAWRRTESYELWKHVSTASIPGIPSWLTRVAGLQQAAGIESHTGHGCLPPAVEASTCEGYA